MNENKRLPYKLSAVWAQLTDEFGKKIKRYPFPVEKEHVCYLSGLDAVAGFIKKREKNKNMRFLFWHCLEIKLNSILETIPEEQRILVYNKDGQLHGIEQCRIDIRSALEIPRDQWGFKGRKRNELKYSKGY